MYVQTVQVKFITMILANIFTIQTHKTDVKRLLRKRVLKVLENAVTNAIMTLVKMLVVLVEGLAKTAFNKSRLDLKSLELVKWRKKNGYTQIRLGKELGVTTITVYSWEKAMREIPPFLHMALKYLELKGGEIETKSKRKRKGSKKTV